MEGAGWGIGWRSGGVGSMRWPQGRRGWHEQGGRWRSHTADKMVGRRQHGKHWWCGTQAAGHSRLSETAPERVKAIMKLDGVPTAVIKGLDWPLAHLRGAVSTN